MAISNSVVTLPRLAASIFSGFGNEQLQRGIRYSARFQTLRDRIMFGVQCTFRNGRSCSRSGIVAMTDDGVEIDYARRIYKLHFKSFERAQ